jgi:GxxExxY protein
MVNKVKTTPYDAITYRITGCAMAVHRELGPGLREDSYQRALANKLIDAEIAFEPQKHKVINDLANRQWLFIPDWLKQENRNE